jgi:hypothetical protein
MKNGSDRQHATSAAEGERGNLKPREYWVAAPPIRLLIPAMHFPLAFQQPIGVRTNDEHR